jgi:hydrogenase maturation protein HypF
LGLLYELFGGAAFENTLPAPLQGLRKADLATLRAMLERRLNSPWTSSVGRLFDAVSALIGLRQQTRFEGQAAMELEFALEGAATEESYPLPMADGRLPIEKSVPQSAISSPQSASQLDWGPMIEAILADLKNGVPAGAVSAKFHNALVEGIGAVARRIEIERVVLTGGCFQNRYLTERAARRLQAAGFRPYWHQRVPPNDGGIALGQVVAALNHYL